MKLKVLFVVLITSKVLFCDINMCSTNSGSIKCCDTYPLVNNYSVTDFEKILKWEIIDLENGVVEVIFPSDFLLGSNRTSIFTLFVENQTENPNCTLEENRKENIDNESSLKKYRHSQIEYEISYGNYSVCSKDIRITFRFIFEGCYHLKLQYGRIYWANKDLKTNYKKNTMSVIPTANPTNRKDGNVDFIIQNLGTFINQKEIFKLEFIFGSPKREEWHMFFNKNDWHKNRTEYSMEICPTHKNFTGLSYCNIINKSEPIIGCKIEGLKEPTTVDFKIGSYSEPRCNIFSIWNNISGETGCSWQIPNVYVTIDEVITTTAATIDLENPLIYVIVVGIVTLVLLGIVVHFLRKRRSRTPNTVELDEVSPILIHAVERNSAVLLLYPRDCSYFMDMMEALRTVLRNEGKLDVFDLYDKTRYNEIASNPENWIRDRLLNCKIILILSECANIQNENGHNRPSMYHNPDSFDNFFLFALRHINQTAENTYRTILVVNISFDEKEYTSFNLLNPYTRFVLPDNLSQILEFLKEEKPNTEHSQEKTLEDTCALEVFLRKYEDFKKYYMRKPDYLLDILQLKTIEE